MAFPLDQYDLEVRKVSVHVIHTTDYTGLNTGTNSFSCFSSFTSLRKVYADKFKLRHQIRTAEEDHGKHRNELKHMIKRSTLYHHNPLIDDDGILLVGTRLRR